MDLFSFEYDRVQKVESLETFPTSAKCEGEKEDEDGCSAHCGTTDDGCAIARGGVAQRCGYRARKRGLGLCEMRCGRGCGAGEETYKY